MEVVGFVSSILTFLDVSYKIVRGTYEIRNTAAGATSENTHVGNVVQDLEEVTSRLRADPQKINDRKLIEISENCYTLSQDLGRLLGKLRAKDGSRRASFKASWAVMRKQSDVKRMEERLDRYRSEIELRLLSIICTGDSVLNQQLVQIRQMNAEVNNQNTRVLENLQNQIDSMIRDMQAHAEDGAARDDDMAENIHQNWVEIGRVHELLDRQPRTNEANSTSDYGLLVKKLDELKGLMHKMPYEYHVLRRLHFDAIHHREDGISNPAAGTYSWMLHEPSCDVQMSPVLHQIGGNEYQSEDTRRRATAAQFMSFLRGDGRIFFISGRAGCGKSTLMKFLGHHYTVIDALESWAAGHKLVVVGMYFWGSNAPLQKTLWGFYRSILYHTLKQCPELMDVIFPGYDIQALSSEAVEFKMSELEAAFSKLIGLRDSKTHRFCYFIDGLDEYDGDPFEHRSIAQKLVAWADSKAVKIVCSARPHTAFLEVFKDVGITISFHQLTQSDIKDFAKSQFFTHLGAPEFREARDTCLSMAEEITYRADGVFLWAGLAVRSLINGALEHEDDSSLHQRLKDCPDDLNIMFRRILGKVDPSNPNRQHSSIVLYLATHNPFHQPLNALLYSWLPDLDWFSDQKAVWELPRSGTPKPLSDHEINERHTYVRRLLHRSTQGLLEMMEDDASIPFFRYRVDFFHRSVRDFLKEEWFSRDAENPFPSPQQKVEIYSQLRAVEAKFAPIPSAIPMPTTPQSAQDRLHRLLEYTFIWLAECEKTRECVPPFHCIREFGEIACPLSLPQTTTGRSHTPLDIFKGSLQIANQGSWRWHDSDFSTGSFLHYASYWHQTSYVRQCLMSGLAARDTTELNLLLTASIATDCDTTHLLLTHGYRPTDRIEIEYPPSGDRCLASVWMVMLRDFANNTASYCWDRQHETVYFPYLDQSWLYRFAKIIESYLRFGADHTVYFIVSAPGKELFHRVNLDQMTALFKPPNFSVLCELLRGKSPLKDRFRDWWLAATNSQHVPSQPKPIWHPIYGELSFVTTDHLLSTRFQVLSVCSERYGDSIDGVFNVKVF